MASAGLCISASGIHGSHPKNRCRFGLVTDSHYADREPYGTRYYRESLNKMEEFIEIMNHEKVDFVMHLGDFKDQDAMQMEADTLRYLAAQESVYARFNGDRFHCVGNHDVDSITKKQFLTHIENSGISNTKSYYSFNRNSYHFVVLDANYHDDGRDHFYKDGVDWQKTHIPEAQIEWLKDDLEHSKYPTLVFCHHPLYAYDLSEETMFVGNYQQVQAVMEASAKVVAVFQGHVHQEDYHELNGIHYLTQFGMVDYSGLENNSFAIVEMDGANIEVLGYKRVSNHSFN
jgi:alkaline phosphatase